MLITRVSEWSGEPHELDVPCTVEQLQAWHAGEKIQDAMPDVPPALREFLISGMTPEEWEEMAAVTAEEEQDDGE